MARIGGMSIFRRRGVHKKYKRAGVYINDNNLTILAGVMRERFFKSLMGFKGQDFWILLLEYQEDFKNVFVLNSVS